MSSDWRNRWRQSRWVTIADFPLLTLDINPETYEGGHPDAGRRGDELLKQAFATEADRIGIKLRMRIQNGYPLHKARHLVRISCQPGEYRPDDMDREVFMRDAIAFAVDEGWAVPGWLRSLIVDAPSSVVSPITSNQSAGEQGAQEYTGYLPAPTASRVLTEQPARADAEPVPEEAHQAEAGVHTDGLVAWQSAMIYSWQEIEKACSGKPNARKAMQWLKKKGPRDVIPIEQPDHNSLAWLDLAGNPQTTSLKTIQNQISRWKADGNIPV